MSYIHPIILFNKLSSPGRVRWCVQPYVCNPFFQTRVNLTFLTLKAQKVKKAKGLPRHIHRVKRRLGGYPENNTSGIVGLSSVFERSKGCQNTLLAKVNSQKSNANSGPKKGLIPGRTTRERLPNDAWS